MNWAITRNGVIELGPRSWSGAAFSKKLKEFGLNSSVAAKEASVPVIIGDVKILPVEYVTPALEINEILTDCVYVVGDNSVVGTYGKRAKTESEINPPVSADVLKRMQLENKYLEATKSLILLAGEAVAEGTWPKLEDVDFETKASAAMANNVAVASLLLATLNYTFFQLKLVDWAWEDIEYRSEIV